jgi:hypothetical protein
VATEPTEKIAMPTNERKPVLVLADHLVDDAHPIAVGATVTIFRLPRHRAPFIEGRAMIRGIMPARNRYRVQFLGDRAVRQRVVHHEFQPNPKQTLKMLLELWCASNEADADEFYPPHDNN